MNEEFLETVHTVNFKLYLLLDVLLSMGDE